MRGGFTFSFLILLFPGSAILWEPPEIEPEPGQCFNDTIENVHHMCNETDNGKLFPHPKYCTMFYECANGESCLKYCPEQDSHERLWFDPELNVCNYPKQTNRTNCSIPFTPIIPILTTPSTTTTTTTKTTTSTTTQVTTDITTKTPETTTTTSYTPTTTELTSTTHLSTSSETPSTSTSSPETTEALEIPCPFNKSTSKEKTSEICIDSDHSCCHPMSESLSTTIGAATVSLSVIGTLGNGFSLAAIISGLMQDTGPISILIFSELPNILLLNLCVFDILYSCVILPIFASVFFHNGWPSSHNMCKLAGLGTHWIVYGERMALAVIALNATKVMGKDPRNEKSSIFNVAAKISFPWIYAIIILLPTYLELAPEFGTFGYNPFSGECNILNPKVFSVLEVLGTYIPFILMASSYTWIGAKICQRQASLGKNDFRERLEKQRLQRAWFIFSMILVYSVCCLPFSLKNALSLWFPLSDFIDGPVMLTLLYFLCVFQFSLNFVIYTIVPNQMRDAHRNMWLEIWRFFKITANTCFTRKDKKEVKVIPHKIQQIDSNNNFSYRRIVKSSSADSNSSTQSSKSPSISTDDIVLYLSSSSISSEDEYYYVTRC